MGLLMRLKLKADLNERGVRVLGREWNLGGRRGDGGVLVWGDERGRRDDAVAAIDGKRVLVGF